MSQLLKAAIFSRTVCGGGYRGVDVKQKAGDLAKDFILRDIFAARGDLTPSGLLFDCYLFVEPEQEVGYFTGHAATMRG